MDDTIYRPDLRFAVGVRRGGTAAVFVAMNDATPLCIARVEFVAGTNIVLVGDVQEPLSRLIENYPNDTLRQKTSLGVQPEALHKLRKHLGIPTYEGLGGFRPGAGRKKKVE